MPSLLIFIFVLPFVIAGNYSSDILISDDYDFSDNNEEDIFHVNTNDLFQGTDFIKNDTLVEPELSVKVDYENPELNIDSVPEEDVEKKRDLVDDYEQQQLDESYLSLDSYSLHVPKFQPQVIIFVQCNLKFCHFAIIWIPNQLRIQNKNSSNCKQKTETLLHCISPIFDYLICMEKGPQNEIGTHKEMYFF